MIIGILFKLSTVKRRLRIVVGVRCWENGPLKMSKSIIANGLGQQTKHEPYWVSKSVCMTHLKRLVTQTRFGWNPTLERGELY